MSALPDSWLERDPVLEVVGAMDHATELVLGGSIVDPLRKLHDPRFTEQLWYYEGSEIGPLIPGNLHAKQEEFRLSPHRDRFFFAGNQTGKTTVGCVDDADFALGRHPIWSDPAAAAELGLLGHEPPVHIWAIALTWELWENILLPELLTWIPKERIVEAPEPRRKSLKRSILVRADNGAISRIEGKSAEQGREAFQSARIHRAHFDEEVPKSVWDEVQLRLVRNQGHTISTVTPLKGLTWLHEDIYVPWKLGQRPSTLCLHAGLADNPSISEEEVERVKRQFANDQAQLAARLYGHFTQPKGLAIKLDPGKHFKTWNSEKELVEKAQKEEWTHFCGIDFGFWRFGFVHCAVDRVKRTHVVGERFSQCESLEARARWIHDHLTRWGAPPKTKIWGDSANPTDIHEINKEFKRIGSPYSVVGVSKGSAEGVSYVRASLSRVNDLLGRGALVIRRDLAETQSWRRGQNVAADGEVTLGSRLIWECSKLCYPEPKEGKAQDGKPDEDTADGADMIAALRYAVMSFWRPPKVKKPKPKPNRNIDTSVDRMLEKVAQHAEARRRGRA